MLTGRLIQVQADTTGDDWSEMSVGKCRIFQSIADVNDVIFILFQKRLKRNTQSTSLIYILLVKGKYSRLKKANYDFNGLGIYVNKWPNLFAKPEQKIRFVREMLWLSAGRLPHGGQD